MTPETRACELADIENVLAFDRLYECDRCTGEVRGRAVNEMRWLCDSWLHADGRKEHGSPARCVAVKPTKAGADLHFQYREGDGRWISLFNVLCQHGKSGLHYQLQVPQFDLHKGKDQDVLRLLDECDKQTRQFWWKNPPPRRQKRSSISLDEPLPPGGRDIIWQAISKLADQLSGLRAAGP